MRIDGKWQVFRIALWALITVTGVSPAGDGLPYADYVNPLVGTDSAFSLSTGNTYPAVAVPWGLNFWTPQTNKMGDGWGYQYDAHKICGFKQTHQPSPWINDYVARTLEYCYDDFTIWKLAQALNRPQEEIDRFYHRAQNYRNVFDPSTHFMRGKRKDGFWSKPFVPEKWGGDFTEGCAWHYTWSVFHDPQGLIDLMGGRSAFVNKLDAVFASPPKYDCSYYGFPIHEIIEMTVMDMGQYAHGNQPIQHMIYLYNYAGCPWKAQMWIRRVMEKLYTPTPDGLCGDEDNGQTSAWYVFSALGFYPVCPGTGQYVLGTPLFQEATLHLQNGKSFKILAPNNSSENLYIQSAQLNDKEHTQTYLRHEDILQGGKIEFKMDATPNPQWGMSPDDAPYSMSQDL